MITIYVILSSAVALLYFFIIRPTKYWARKNVPTGRVIPIFGNYWNMVMGNECFAEMSRTVYEKMPSLRYYGGFQFTTPMFIVRSPDLIKRICVTDFEHFHNRSPFLPETATEYLTKTLFSLKSQLWKEMRTIIVPSFNNNNLKSMLELMGTNAKNFTEYFLNKNKNLVEVEMKEVFSRYTIDIMTNIAFGVESDSLKEPNNEFYRMGRNATNFNTKWKSFVFLLYTFLPRVAQFLNLSLLGHKEHAFIMKQVDLLIKAREQQKINKPDMLGLLLEAREEKNKGIQNAKANDGNNFSLVEITGQIVTFFLGGFENVSTVMGLMAYELALRPDVQKLLIEEIDQNKQEDGKVSFEVIMNMPYMNMVLTETLRKYPNASSTERIVTKPYTIQPELPGEKPVHLKVGEMIFIPIMGMHYDPKYYKDPEKFEPERFSPENKNLINPYAYIPFGAGPRNCIGSRFSLMEIKTIFFYLLSHFEIEPVAKTPVPLKLNKNSFFLTPATGLPLALRRRKLIV